MEIREKAGVIEHLRQSNVRTAEQLERAKVRADSMVSRLEETMACLHQSEAKSGRKDYLIRTVVDIWLQLIPDQEFRSNFVHLLRQNTVKPSHFRLAGKGPDFSLETLCSYMESEARRRKTSKPTSLVAEERSGDQTPTLPTPTDFKVARKVGTDSLLVSWTAPALNQVSGYLVSPMINFGRNILNQIFLKFCKKIISLKLTKFGFMCKILFLLINFKP